METIVMSSPSRVHRAVAAVRSYSHLTVKPRDQGKQFAVVRSHSSGLPLKVETRVRTPLGLLQVRGVFGVFFGHCGWVSTGQPSLAT
jgi:hypothetical protein